MTKYQVTAQEKRILPWLAAVGFFMQALDGTILNTALPTTKPILLKIAITKLLILVMN